MCYAAENLPMRKEAEFFKKVVDYANEAKINFVEMVMEFMSTLKTKEIAIWGFAFKKGTSDTRYSPAIDVCRKLLEHGAHLRIHDPHVRRAYIHKHFRRGVSVVETPSQATEGADAIWLTLLRRMLLERSTLVRHTPDEEHPDEDDFNEYDSDEDPEWLRPELRREGEVGTSVLKYYSSCVTWNGRLHIFLGSSQGQYQEKPTLPFVPGSDYSGVIESVGAHVSKFKVGDRVCSFAALGTFAHFIVADQNDLFLIPDGCDLVTAGALPVAFGTSHVALVHRAQLGSGQVLLVLGAAGGVGLSAVQIGKVCGAVVIAVARGAEKVQFLKSLGVDHVVDLSKDSIIESVKGFLKARKLKGVDVLYDPVGGKPTKRKHEAAELGGKNIGHRIR
ncbi:hypothetical protein IFM89_037229 [Coptis chinensis]|uniref:Enoyl reductase (ER) domain-containing protein n=1 Tax=Coptis chinensis TaxID=261450 RepID=A0A835HAW8_9MAGN|nr:hypothetical protein IFM89_037229 [Coptis chinensis]